MKKWDELEKKHTTLITKHFQDITLLENLEELISVINTFLILMGTPQKNISKEHLALVEKQKNLQKQYDELFGVIVTDMKSIMKIITGRGN